MKKLLLLFSSALVLSVAGSNVCYGQYHKTAVKAKPAPAKPIASAAPVKVAEPAAPKEHSVVSVAIINSSVPNAKVLMKGLEPGVKVFVAREDEMIADLFKRIGAKCEKSNESIGTIAVFGYGKNGEFEMGGDKISAKNLKYIKEDFEALSPFLVSNPNLLVYTSEVGGGKNGDKLMTSLKEVFPGNIYMSNNLTGKDGDWELEVSNSADPAPALVNAEYMNKFYKFSVGKQ